MMLPSSMPCWMRRHTQVAATETAEKTIRIAQLTTFMALRTAKGMKYASLWALMSCLICLFTVSIWVRVSRNLRIDCVHGATTGCCKAEGTSDPHLQLSQGRLRLSPAH